MECLVKNTNKSLISNRLPAGTIFYWAGKKDTIPEWALFCNGDSFQIPTSEEDEMWDLYQAIGTIYNKAAGSGYNDTTPAGYFSIPDFIRIVEDGQEKQVGLFIRSATNDDQVGVKQNDAIRNITALTGWVSDYSSQFAVSHSGAFYYNNTRRDGFVPTSYLQKAYSGTFNANLDSNDYGNPMSGHANGEDIHPYNIAVLPLISY